MLGKLMKHELKATGRYFLPLFLIALVLTPITRLTTSFQNTDGIWNFITGIIIFLYVVSLIMIAAASVILIIQRFYKSMVTEEGYLMHTLPVSISTHIWAKLLVAALWSILCFLVIALSLFMMFYHKGDFTLLMRGLNEAWIYIRNDIGNGNFTLLAVEVSLIMLVNIIGSPLIFYASIAIGQLIGKNKVLGSVAGFFILQISGQILGGLLMVPVSFALKRYFTSITLSPATLLTNYVFPIALVLNIVVYIILFVITNLIFKKKLNLD